MVDNEFTEDSELRRLTIDHREHLCVLIDRTWHKLMQHIPKTSQIGHPNPEPKYGNEDIQNLKRTASESRKKASALLIGEWATTGRVETKTRPTLGLLRDLLVRAELLRAADYVSIDILGQGRVPRPASGPAAAVDIALPDESELDPSILKAIRTPDLSLLVDIKVHHVNQHNNLDYIEKNMQGKTIVEARNNALLEPVAGPSSLSASRRDSLPNGTRPEITDLIDVAKSSSESNESRFVSSSNSESAFTQSSNMTTTNDFTSQSSNTSRNLPDFQAIGAYANPTLSGDQIKRSFTSTISDGMLPKFSELVIAQQSLQQRPDIIEVAKSSSELNESKFASSSNSQPALTQSSNMTTANNITSQSSNASQNLPDFHAIGACANLGLSVEKNNNVFSSNGSDLMLPKFSELAIAQSLNAISYDRLVESSQNFGRRVSQSGSLFKANHLIPQHGLSAIKIFPPGYNADYEREREWMNKIMPHKNIAQLYGFSRNGSTHYLIYELSPHSDCLRDQFQTFDWSQRVGILRSIATALAFIHKEGFWHGNLITENILFETEVVKIYGLGCASGGNVQQDIYQFCLIIFELITGRRDNLDMILNMTNLLDTIDPNARNARDNIRQVELLFKLAIDTLNSIQQGEQRLSPTMAQIKDTLEIIRCTPTNFEIH